MITTEKIKRFRDRINTGRFVLNKYKDYNGKNIWSCICSSTDWISVACDYLEKNPSPEPSQNDNIYSVNVFTYISCVDMIFEALKQLHRAFISSQNEPFSGEKGILKHNEYCKDDNDYFKLIRASFGAHSVNLYDKFTSEAGEKRFASWSGKMLGNGTFGVRLYSVIPGKEDVTLTVSFSEINAYLERIYGYLDYLHDTIDKDEQQFIEEKRAQKITWASNECELLCILERENKLRFDNDDYDYEIAKLKQLFCSNIRNKNNLAIVMRYRNKAKKLVHEIYFNLQKMNNADLMFTDDIEISSDLPHVISKGFSEIINTLFTDVDVVQIFLPSVIEYVSPYIIIDGAESLSELYVLITVGLLEIQNQKTSNPLLLF